MNRSTSAPAPGAIRRDNRSLLQFLERPVLRWLATSMPAWMTPDMLTGIGFFGAVLSAAAYAGSRTLPAMLWLASVGILVNWFGDSLDGTLARARGIERPVYGFFIDNSTDVLEYGLFAVGFGLSGYVRWELVAATLAAFYMVMLLGLIKAVATNVFQIAFAGTGLTEVRCAFVLANAIMFFAPPQPFLLGGTSTTYPNLVAMAWIAMQVVTFLVGMIKTLRELSAQDPAKRARDGQI